MVSVSGLITGPLARILESGRSRYNAKFAQARWNHPQLNVQAFADHLRTVVAPVAESVEASVPEKVEEVVDTLYDISLDLISRDIFARHPVIAEGWVELLGGLPRHLAASPKRFTASVTNALFNLSTSESGRAAQWCAIMKQAGSATADVSLLLEAGKIAAWRCGMAHYRKEALRICGVLPPELVCAALDIRGELSPQEVQNVVDRMKEDPWFVPDAGEQTPPKEKRLRMAAEAGGFRGFGGLFISPPKVSFADGNFIVYDVETCWRLQADAFGSAFLRENQLKPASSASVSTAFSVDLKGRVKMGDYKADFPELSGATSFASDGTTLAVTIPFSHAVYLIAYT